MCFFRRDTIIFGSIFLKLVLRAFWNTTIKCFSIKRLQRYSNPNRVKKIMFRFFYFYFRHENQRDSRWDTLWTEYPYLYMQHMPDTWSSNTPPHYDRDQHRERREIVTWSGLTVRCSLALSPLLLKIFVVTHRIDWKRVVFLRKLRISDEGSKKDASVERSYFFLTEYQNHNQTFIFTVHGVWTVRREKKILMNLKRGSYHDWSE